MDIRILEQAGLSKGEANIYLILLKLGESVASDIAKHTRIARPNVYDYLNKLKEKGFVSFVKKDRRTYYTPSSPERLLEYINEKKEVIENNLLELMTLYKSKNVSQIETYEGSQGFRIIMNDIIKAKSDIVGWGGSDKVRQYIQDYYVERYIRQREKYNIKARLLHVEGESTIKTSLTQFKSIPKEYSSPSTTLTYADRVVIMIYDALPVIVLIKSKELAKSYKKHFELLWSAAV